MSDRGRREVLRRYPALGFIAVAAVLALLLPSGLTIPSAGPSSLSEYAPGSDGDAAGDISALGDTSSAGLGSALGGRSTGGRNVPAALGAPDQRRPSLKACVGNPPRQTEDPLSPPCVAFFEGDNGGATTRGVSADEIVVVLHWGSAGRGNATRFVDYAEEIHPDDSDQDRAGKAYARFFGERYQTYGRRLHLYGYYGHYDEAANNVTASALRADVAELEAFGTFAVVTLDLLSAPFVSEEAARRGIVAATFRSFGREAYRRVAPRLIGYAPDLDDIARSGANYACRKLVDRPARHSGNAADLGATRELGVIYSDAPEDRTWVDLATLFRAALERECGRSPAEVRVAGGGRESFDKYPEALAQLRGQGVTTVIPFLKGATDPVLMLNAASAQGWYPEWFFIQPVPFLDAADSTFNARLHPQDQWRHAFGITFDYRRPSVPEQHWYRAFKDACPECTVGVGANRAYDVLALLMYGIQSAGPRLHAETLDKGLHAVPERPSRSPFVPATYFAPGNYSWIKDAKEMWWDPSGVPPGDSRPGCYRLPNGGRRFRPGEWAAGDGDLFASGQPCQAEARAL